MPQQSPLQAVLFTYSKSTRPVEKVNVHGCHSDRKIHGHLLKHDDLHHVLHFFFYIFSL